MSSTQDGRPKELKRIEHLLYGFNYEVRFYLYGPASSELGLIEALRSLVSEECELYGVNPSSPKTAMAEIMEMILYKGDASSGPVDLDAKKAEVTELMDRVFSHISVEDAEMVSEFALKEGHPAYPVFWDFAYDIHSNGQRWIFIGSSSD